MAKPYATIICTGGLVEDVPGCGSVELSLEAYNAQMARPHQGWRCPQCGGDADFDDAEFERIHGINQGDDDEPPR